MAPASRQAPSPTCAHRRKNVLFCPSCAHESPADGNWRRQARGNDTVYRCPSCGVDVTVRPTDASSPVSPSHESSGRSIVARSVDLAAGSMWLTLAWSAWPCAPEEWCHSAPSRRR